MSNEHFDFIVTGAGSAGCAVAARLSEDGRYSVLLLEAGPRDRNPWIHIPVGVTKLFSHKYLNWRFESEPIEGLNNRRVYQPRGKVLGGTSSINGMVYMRGNPADYDGWRQRGCDGWDWNSVLPFFKKSEDQGRGEDEFHGAGGPLKVSDLQGKWPLPRAIIAAAVEAGIPANSDFNGPSQEGAGFYQFTATRTRRWSSAKAYLNPARHRNNLKIVTSALATRLILEEGRAWAEAKIKQMTGGDVIKARFMRQDNFEFLPKFKLFLIGNNQPNLKQVDNAHWRRFNIVPFIYKPPRIDFDLEEKKLKPEWPAIFRWFIEGCLKWQKTGLKRPQVVIEATEEYFAEQDLLKQWVDECCDLKPTLWDKTANLFESYSKWMVARGELPGTQTRLTQALKKKYRLPKHPDTSVRGQGIRVRKDGYMESDDA
jgi:hypothetical protein